MKRRVFARLGLGLGLGCSLILAASGAWSQASSSTARPKSVPPESLSTPSKGLGVSDSVLTARAKIALMRADHIDSNDVHVSTSGGVVKLEGHVSTAEQKQKAGDTVQSLDGVTAVQNDLVVGGGEK